MFKTQVEPRAAGELFHWKVSNISVVYKSVDHGKLWWMCFSITFIFFWRKTKNKTSGTAWPFTSFPWSKLSETIALDQSARDDSLSYCKNLLRQYTTQYRHAQEPIQSTIFFQWHAFKAFLYLLIKLLVDSWRIALKFCWWLMIASYP